MSRSSKVGFASVFACMVCIAVFTGESDVRAQGREFVESHYTKFEYRIPMRDGKRLFTSVYVPKLEAGLKGPNEATPRTRFPILLTRTPYSCQPYGVDRYRDELGPPSHFVKSGYIFAYQDVRGRWMSEGEFVNMRPHLAAKKGLTDIDESTDTYDTIEWLVKNVELNNGRVGVFGISYPGFYTAAGMIDAHPALKACSPQAPVSDWFIGDDWHHHGALFLPHAFNFMATFGRPRPEPTRKFKFEFDHDTPDGYDFFLKMGSVANADRRYFKGDVAFWNEVMEHGNYDDWWKARNIRQHLNGIKPAVMTVGGWFDAENLFGALEVYKKIEASSRDTENVLVMGPWAHGAWFRQDGKSLGMVDFRSKTAEFYREKIEFPFFERHLMQKTLTKHPEAWVFETGVNRWREFEAWPPKEAKSKSLYLHPAGKLAWSAPNEDNGADDYISDPAKPVPFQDKIDIGMTKEYMVEDQRFAARRPDVVTYQTPPLEEDLTLAGPIEAKLFVSTSGTDSDWVVKVIDVYPSDYPDPTPNPTMVKMGGYQQLVRGEVMRGKFRKSYEKPEPFTPGAPAEVNFTIQDVFHTFRPGHRVMIQVQSSWFPLVDRNPQKFVDIYKAKDDDFQKAEQKIYRSAKMPSRVEVQVLP